MPTDDINPLVLLNNLWKEYTFNVTGPIQNEHGKMFSAKLEVKGLTFKGSGPSKKAAKGVAATRALKHPGINGNAEEFKASLKKQENNSTKTIQTQPKNPVRKKLVGNPLRNPPLSHVHQSNQHSDFHQRQSLLGNMLPQNTPLPVDDTYLWLQFCPDYVLLQCAHPKCKLLHVNKDDEDTFLASGNVPSHVVEQAIRKALVDDSVPHGVIPVCKPYLDGECNWYSCPLRHLSRQDFSREVLRLLHNQFEKKVHCNEDYRLIVNRLLESEPRGYDRRRIRDDGYDSQLANRRYQEGHVDSTWEYERLGPQSYQEYGRELGKLGPQNYLGGRRDYEMLRPDDHSVNRDYERRLQEGLLAARYGRPLSGGGNRQTSGQQNLRVGKDFDKMREVDNLQEQMGNLLEENHRLRDAFRMMSLEGDKFARHSTSQSRGDLYNNGTLTHKVKENEAIRKLKLQNEEMKRKLLLRDQDILGLPSSQLHGHLLTGDNFSANMNAELGRTGPEDYVFQKLLNAGLNKKELANSQHMLGIPQFPKKVQQMNTSSKQVKKVFTASNKGSSPLQNVVQKPNGNKQMCNGKQVKVGEIPAKKSGQIIQIASRPSISTKHMNTAKKSYPNTRKGRKQQQDNERNQQKQKTSAEQKQHQQNTGQQKNKVKATVKVEKTKQDSLNREPLLKETEEITRESNAREAINWSVDSNSGGSEGNSVDDVVLENTATTESESEEQEAVVTESCEKEGSHIENEHVDRKSPEKEASYIENEHVDRKSPEKEANIVKSNEREAIVESNVKEAIVESNEKEAIVESNEKEAIVESNEKEAIVESHEKEAIVESNNDKAKCTEKESSEANDVVKEDEKEVMPTGSGSEKWVDAAEEAS